ncbi:anti-anti-sigma factor [Amycolatopsis bartoniae]|uniref:Anti-sigma factor antagonist n=1 Tax=Amycolatopsis bartoniae TaxID=941986 RepID=A0A8H9IZ88_9PSEU|nr:STAS domain-containing protein [Amycolatopsis bartoniae]MBB2935636.1 anti-anti-sigma factor [Amycolatopsis bartoniae]TVT02086.1 STAS domain-containing protein [Amycolatopsis bartoniae]GHF60776.1 anti-sigma factor antagonist [Amycolatopsis bartoniae]
MTPQPPVPHPGSLSLSTHWPEPDVVVLSVAGDLDMLTSPQLSESLQKLLERSPRRIVVDLTKVDFLGSAGLAALVTAHERVESRESLRIVASARETQRAFQMTGLDELLALYPTAEAALADG